MSPSGAEHLFGPDDLVELLAGQEAQLHARLAQRLALRVRLLGDLRRLVVADARVQAPSPASASCATCCAICSRFGSMPATQCSVNDRQASASSRIECRKLWMITGLKTFSSKLPCEPATADGRVVAHHLHADHRHRLALRRVDLARHDRRARLVLRQRQLAQAAARAGAQPADVVGDLHQRTGQRLQGAAGHDQRVVGGQGRELVRRRRRTAARSARRSSSPRARRTPGGRSGPVPTAVPPRASSYSVGQRLRWMRCRPASSWAT